MPFEISQCIQSSSLLSDVNRFYGKCSTRRNTLFLQTLMKACFLIKGRVNFMFTHVQAGIYTYMTGIEQYPSSTENTSTTTNHHNPEQNSHEKNHTKTKKETLPASSSKVESGYVFPWKEDTFGYIIL